MNEEDVKEQLKEKNKEIYLNKLNLDLTNNIEVLKLTLENFLNNKCDNIKNRILNIVESFQKEKIIDEKVKEFLEKYRENLFKIIELKQKKLELEFTKTININEYKNNINISNSKIINNINEYYEKNKEELMEEITNLFDNKLCKVRIKDYFNTILKKEMEDKIMYIINSRDLILLNTIKESYLKYLELNEKTVGIKLEN